MVFIKTVVEGKMKVLLNTPPLDCMGGVATFYLNLREHLGDEIVYFHTGRRNGESSLRSVLRLVVDYMRFVLVLCQTHFDIVHLNPSLGLRAIWRDAVFILIARAFRKKTVVFMHGWNKDYEEALRKRGLWLFQITYLRVNAFMVLASEFKLDLRFMGYTGPVHIVTTTFDSALLQQASGYKKRTNSKEPFNILFLTRIERQKGIFEALESLAILQTIYPNVHMTVAGTGTALEEAQKYVIDNNIHNVEFVGYVRGRQKTENFSTAHCYLFPSYSEGMPISVVEAMAFGLPVITRPVGALADFFRDGEMGFLTASKDPAVFARLVEQLIVAPALCDKMSRINREYAMGRFSSSSVVDRFSSIYRNVATADALNSRTAKGEA